MASTVDVPGVGAVDKRLMWGSLAAAALFVGFMYWRNQGGGGTQTAVVDPDAVGVDTYNPAPSGDSTVDVDATDDGITTDAEWTNAVVESLSALGGWDGQVVAIACGRYLGRQTLTATDVEIIRTARGLVGEAPSGPHPLNQGPGTPPPGETTTYNATRKGTPDTGGWALYKGRPAAGWYVNVHSNWTAVYRGNYDARAPEGSAAEGRHINALRARNVTHPFGWKKTVYLPARLNDNGTWAH